MHQAMEVDGHPLIILLNQFYFLSWPFAIFFPLQCFTYDGEFPIFHALQIAFLLKYSFSFFNGFFSFIFLILHMSISNAVIPKQPDPALKIIPEVICFDSFNIFFNSLPVIIASFFSHEFYECALEK